jgi:hypothetical protein
MFDDRQMSENQYLDEVYGDEDEDEEEDFEDDEEWDEDDDLDEILN